jgi:hypothetical protein
MIFCEGFRRGHRRWDMKLSFFVLCASAMIPAVALAQNAAPVPAPPPSARVGPRPLPQTVTSSAEEDEPRFDFKFAGGPVKEFVTALGAARGKPVNVVISKEAESTLIPPVEVYRVTVSALFRALSAASERQVMVRSGNTYQLKNVGFTFVSSNQDSGDAVWTFRVMDAPESIAEQPPPAERVVQFYPVAEYLTHFSVEDITTAIEAGWNLQSETKAEKTPRPTIKFHEETKLLICAGSKLEIEIIPQVLKGLSQMLQYPRTDNLKITRKAKEILIPKVEFRDASIREAVEFIRRKALELDPEKQGVNVLLHEINPQNGPADQRVSLSLINTPVIEVLRLTAELGNADLEIRDSAILLRTRPHLDPHAVAGGGHGAAPPPGPPGIPGLEPHPGPPPPIGISPAPGAPRPLR